MNEFTKKELKHLHDLVYEVCLKYREPDLSYELRDKLQSMVDNYCEHENSSLIYMDGPSWSRMKCNKCNEEFWE